MADPANRRWPIIEDILRKEGIARQHLNSFNEFLDRGMQEIIDEVGQSEIDNPDYPYKVRFGKVAVLVLIVAVVSIVAITARSRLSAVPRF